MAGIYIHIPFCKQACHYCNFHFSTLPDQQGAMIAALQKEIILQRDFLQQETIETIYWGGGTPSLLAANAIVSLLDTVRQHHNVHPNAEITLEANPDDISVDRLLAWKAAGINRLSIGIQSFDERELQWMNRAHTANQSVTALTEARRHFSNITIDLIYGIPGSTHAAWKQTLDRVVTMGIEHVSCYALTVEPKTALEKKIARKKTPPIDGDHQSDQFLIVMDTLQEAGYRHYEISNFAIPGKESRHNTAYWQGVPYLGIGPSAHSFRDDRRQWNVANNALYLRSIEQDRIPFEEERLTPEQQLNEYIMTALRTDQGIDLNKTGTQLDPLLKRAATYLETGHLLLQNERLSLSREGKLLADGIAAHLFTD